MAKIKAIAARDRKLVREQSLRERLAKVDQSGAPPHISLPAEFWKTLLVSTTGDLESETKED